LKERPPGKKGPMTMEPRGFEGGFGTEKGFEWKGGPLKEVKEGLSAALGSPGGETLKTKHLDDLT